MADESQHPRVMEAPAQESQQDLVVYPIEELLQIEVHGKGLTFSKVGLHLLDGLMRAFARSEPITSRMEAPIDFVTQHLRDGLLDHSIQHRRNPQRTFAPAGFVDLRPPHRGGPVKARLQPGAHFAPVLPHPGWKVRDAPPVDARGTAIGAHLFPGPAQVAGLEDRRSEGLVDLFHAFEALDNPPGSAPRLDPCGPASAGALNVPGSEW